MRALHTYKRGVSAIQEEVKITPFFILLHLNLSSFPSDQITDDKNSHMSRPQQLTTGQSYLHLVVTLLSVSHWKLNCVTLSYLGTLLQPIVEPSLFRG